MKRKAIFSPRRLDTLKREIVEQATTSRPGATSRADAAALGLMRSFSYNEGADVRFGPGTLIPVVADPEQFLFPL